MGMSETKTNPEPVGNTLLEQVCVVFENINRTGAASHAWRDAWRKSLNLESVPEINLYDALMLIGRAIERIQEQIRLSRNMSQRAKNIAQPILSELYTCVLPSSLHVAANTATDKFTQDKMNQLRLAADALEREFTEPRIPKSDFDELVQIVNELVHIVEGKDTPVPPDLASILAPHIKFMQWAVQNYHTIGVEGLMRAFTLTGLYIRRVDPKDVLAATNVSWWAKVKTGFGRAFKIVDNADKAVRLGERGYHLGHEIAEVIGLLPPS